MIDLDEREHQPTKAGATTTGRLVASRKAITRSVAAFVAGVVLGGFGLGEVRDSREQRERNAVVALVAVPQAANFGGSYAQGTVQLPGRLLLINAGPAPITVRGVRAERPGVVVGGTWQPRSLPPGGAGQFVVELRFECAIAFQPEPLSLRLSVETNDSQLREVSYPVALAGSDWERDTQGMCDESRRGLTDRKDR
ncbi:hypothetical protein [Micromonospora sp. NPDC049891]|uniref:hypothetical protein n=1 Tax=Micromonospora sp. NPDC049891 TaxID=3155655 RepID=UPI0033CF6CD1